MEPLVSICCITYNHEKYITDALDSFLTQETTFPFEIIVHDDASTDKTAVIIREYEERYPKIIKPIYQTENQYSKGKGSIRNYVVPMIKGKYTASCEGDDFWTDPLKLQKQVEFLEENPEYTMCFHKVKVIDTKKNFLGRYLGPKCNKSKAISVSEAVTGGIVHVSSRITRSDFYIKPRPNWIRNAKHGDYATALYIAAEGKIYYMNEVMSAYRTGVKGSMMTNFRKNYTKENDINYLLNRIETLDMADKYYDYKYHDEIIKVRILSQVAIDFLKNDFSNTAMRHYKIYIKQNGLIKFIKLMSLKKFPAITKPLVKLKGLVIAKKSNVT